MYGLKHESTKHFDDMHKNAAISNTINMMDSDNDGVVTKEEWLAFIAAGGELPDLGMGPGHHGDDEYEYELHHWDQ